MSNNNNIEEEEELPHFSVKSSNRKSDKSGGSRKKQQQHRGKEPIQDSGIDSSFFISANSGVMSNNFLPNIPASQRDRSFQN